MSVQRVCNYCINQYIRVGPVFVPGCGRMLRRKPKYRSSEISQYMTESTLYTTKIYYISISIISIIV